MIGSFLPHPGARALRAATPALVLLLLPVVSLLLQPDVAGELHRQWTTSGEIDYGYLLLAAATFFYLRDVATRKATDPSPVWLLPALVAAVGIALAGEIQLQAAVLIGIAGFWGCASLAVFGLSSMNLTLICCSLLILATPVPFLLVPYLRELTVVSVTSLTKLAGITAYIENNLIYLPTGTIEIADGCAGEKYLRSSLIMALIAIALKLHRFNALITLGFFTGAALLANWARVFVLVVIADRTSTENSLVLEHDWLGWLIFAVVLGLVFWFVLAPKRVAGVDSAPGPNQADEAGLPAGDAGHGRRQLFCLLAAIGLAFTPLITGYAMSRVSNQVTEFSSLAVLANCSPVRASDSGPVNLIEAADVELTEALDCRFEGSERQMYRYSAAYQTAERGNDLTGWLNAPVDPKDWNVLKRFAKPVGPEQKVGVLLADQRSTRQRWAIIHWYETEDRVTPSALEFKVRTLLARLSGRYSESTTRLYVRCSTDCAESVELLLDLAGKTASAS